MGTSTAESAPAASSSNSTFETELDAWYALPRKVVPSTAAITQTRTKPIPREARVATLMRVAARVGRSTVAIRIREQPTGNAPPARVT